MTARSPYTIGHRMTVEEEFLRLMDLKRRTDDRLDLLVAIIDPDGEISSVAGLRQADPRVLLWKGGARV